MQKCPACHYQTDLYSGDDIDQAIRQIPRMPHSYMYEYITIAIVPFSSIVSTGSVIATTATDKLTRSAYTLKNPKNASNATTSRRRCQNRHVIWWSLDASLKKKADSC